MTTERDHNERPVIVQPTTGCPPWEHDVSLCGRWNPMKPTQSAPEPSQAATEAHAQEVERLKMGLWDVWVALGHDTDGDTGPGALIAGMGVGGFIGMVLRDAETWRRESEEDYDLDMGRLEAKIVRVQALHKVDDFGLCIECRQGFPCDTREALDGDA